MKNVFEKEYIKKYSKIIYFSIIVINIIVLFGLSFQYYKINKKQENIKIEQQKQAEERIKKEQEEKEQQKQVEEEKNINTIEEKKLLENFILINKNEITPYNAFDNKKTDYKQIEFIATSFYKLFNTDSLKEYIKNFNNFDPNIGGIFSPGYENLTEEQLNKPYKLSQKVRMLIEPHNLYKKFTIIIFVGEISNQRFFMFRGYVTENGKINLKQKFDFGTLEQIGGEN